MIIKVGCCGFPGGMSKYFNKYKLVEVQQTFYKPPKPTTLRRWRESAPEDFEFSVKAWQIITHPSTSPTYRKAKISLSDEDLRNAGYFRNHKVVIDAWNITKEACKILESKICVFQTPSSFKPTDDNISNMKAFFSQIDRDGLILGWEPRGKDWKDDIVKDICERLKIIHIVDPFANDPFHVENKIMYFRLHGMPPGNRMYNYKYTVKDFDFLLEKLKTFEQEFNIEEVYFLFNNIYMDDDAAAFIKYLEKKKQYQILK